MRYKILFFHRQNFKTNLSICSLNEWYCELKLKARERAHSTWMGMDVQIWFSILVFVYQFQWRIGTPQFLQFVSLSHEEIEECIVVNCCTDTCIIIEEFLSSYTAIDQCTLFEIGQKSTKYLCMALFTAIRNGNIKIYENIRKIINI